MIGRFFIRLSHRRGHSIHSPLVYGIARNVFMRRGDGGELSAGLVAQGVKKRYAYEIGRLQSYLGVDIVIATQTIEVAENTALCLLYPHKNKSAYRELLDGDCTISIDRRKYAIFLYDKGLPKQHFIL